MYVCAAIIEIGQYTFESIHEGEITKGVDEISDTAWIKLPTQFMVKGSKNYVYTEDAIKIGDPVKITLSYEGHYIGVEFKGFVKKIRPTIPLHIEMEDSIWLLRRKNIAKTWEKTTLKEILQEVVKDTEIKLSDAIPDVVIDKWVADNVNGAQVLESIRKELLLSSFIDDDNKLYCGLEQLTNIGQSVIYDLNYNLVENNLEYKAKAERRIKIEYEYINPDTNERTIVSSGDMDGEKRSYKTSVVSDKNKLQELSDAELKRFKYDGFEGDVVSFLIPYATRGMSAQLIDEDHKNRQGNYFIKKVITQFGQGGFRRKVSLGAKL